MTKKAKRPPKRPQADIDAAIKRRIARNLAAAAATRRQKSIDERLSALGLTKKSAEEWNKIKRAIGQNHAVGSRLSALKKDLRDAKTAYGDSVLNSDDIEDWVAAARKAVRLD